MEIVNSNISTSEVGLSWACLVACGMSCLLTANGVVAAFATALEAF